LVPVDQGDLLLVGQAKHGRFPGLLRTVDVDLELAAVLCHQRTHLVCGEPDVPLGEELSEREGLTLFVGLDMDDAVASVGVHR